MDRFVLPLASGLLLGLTFTPMGGPVLPLLAFAPLGTALGRRAGPGDGLVPGFIVAGVGHGIGLHWMVPALSWRTPLAVLVWLLVLCLIGIVAALAVESALRLHRRWRLPLPLALGFTWVGLEWVAAHVPGVSYAWLNAGGSLVWWPWAADWISLGGSPLLTVWTVAVGVLVGGAASTRRRGALLLATAAALLPVLAGTLTPKDGSQGTLRSVAAVQPGRRAPGGGSTLLAWQDSISRVSGGNPLDLIVFPERFLVTEPDRATGDHRLATALGAPVLFGAVDSLRSGDSSGGADARSVGGDANGSRGGAAVANAAFLVRPGRSGRQVAHKRRLVPWLESGGLVPGRPGSVGYEPGREAVLFDVGGWRVGVLICYDVAFSELARELAEEGADALVVISNDDWLDPEKPLRTTLAYWQHETLGRLRAVENGVPLLQVATTGRTFSVDEWGRRDAGLGEGPPPLVPAVATLRVRTGGRARGFPNQGRLLGLVGVLALALGAWPERVPGVRIHS